MQVKNWPKSEREEKDRVYAEEEESEVYKERMLVMDVSLKQKQKQKQKNKQTKKTGASQKLAEERKRRERQSIC